MKRAVIAAPLVLLLAGPARAAVTELVIYKDNDFRGASQVVKGEVAHLEDGFARAASSLVVRGGYWEACDRHHFKGDCRVLAAGDYPRLGDWTKRIVSLRFLGDSPRFAMREPRRSGGGGGASRPGRGAVDLFQRPGFRGPLLRVHDNERDLAERNFDGRAASAVVHEGTWVLCTERAFLGRCAVLPPGQYERLIDLEDRVWSLRQVR